MQVNICSPFLHGAKVTSRLPGQLEMTIVVRATYRLAPDAPLEVCDDMAARALQGDLFDEADDDRAGALRWASDFSDFKLQADVLLHGTCHPPGGRAARECPVRFSVGAWSKSLRVVGRRVWTERAFDPISEPALFTSMPLRYEHAFGGPAFADNPVGKGQGTAELPCIEDPAAPIRSRRDAPAPAGFAPISPNWPQRKSKLGTDYGKNWKKTRAPFYAADFDWSSFNAAPSDQRLSEYLRGDEALVFENLHPTASRFSTRLPGVRPRVLCRRVDGATTDVPMNLDTLVADLEGERLVLVWRGLARVEEDDLHDVRTLFLAREEIAAPRPARELVAELDKFEADPVGYLRDQLVPASSKKAIEDAARLRAEVGAPPPMPDVKGPGDAAGHVEEALARHGKDTPPDVIAGVVARLRDFIGQHAGKLDSLGPRAASSGGPSPTIGGLESRLAATLADRKAALAARGQSTARIEEAEKRLADTMAQQRAAEAAANKPGAPGLFASIDRAGVDAANASGGAAAGAAEVEPPKPPEVGAGRDLSGVDLTDRDLRGVDLSGARLRGAKLVRAKLTGAKLANADLSEADLEDADLGEADLTQAIFKQAKARGARFDGAKIDRALFVDADLAGASFAGASGQMAIFARAKLAPSSFANARFHKVVFASVEMDGADLSGAELELCQFVEVQAKDAKLDGARLVKTAFLRAKMPGASFVEAKGGTCSFLGCALEGADFRFAKLRGSQFVGARLGKARLYAADLRGGRFDRATLDGADFGKADLMSASFNKASLAAVDFSGASLYDAKFLGAAATARCNFDGANLKRALWDAS